MFGQLITSDAQCKRGIILCIAMGNATFDEKKKKKKKK
jgi:hypothetical protein